MLFPEAMRKPAGKVDLGGLRKHLETTYASEVGRYEGALGELSRLREALRSGKWDGKTADETLKQTVLRYAALLSAAVKHFPFGEAPGQIRVEFIWSAGLLGNKERSFDPAVEIRGVRTAAAALLMSEAALAFADDSEVGTKKAAAALGQALSMLQGVGGGGDEAGLLEAVSLAQQQECYVWAAERSNKAGATVAALAWAAEERMSTCQALAAKVYKGWAGRLGFKKNLMFAIAACGEAREEDRTGALHGVKIGRLLEASKRLKGMGVEKGYEKQMSHYVDQVDRLLRLLVKENDAIYFNRIGDGSPGQGKLLARAPAAPADDDAFAGLIPPAVAARLQRYGDWRRVRIQASATEAERLGEEMRLTLQRLGLPGALDGGESGVPPGLRAQADEVSRAGGAARLRELEGAKRQLEQEAERLLSTSTASLDSEARLQRPGQTPSQLLTLPMRQELARLSAALEAARQSDALVQRKTAEVEPHLPALASLDATLARLGAAVGGALPPKARELREALAQLDGLLRQRQSAVAGMRERGKAEMREKRVEDALADFGLSDEAVFDALWNKGAYAAEEQVIRETGAKQSALLNSVQGMMAGWQQPVLAPRHVACQELSRAAALFREILDNHAEGITFYTDLQALLLRLHQSALDFCFARGTERNDQYQDQGYPPPNAPPPYDAVAPSAPPLNNWSNPYPAAPQYYQGQNNGPYGN